jgi:hypothetical protein
MSDANKDDLANVCCHIVGGDVNEIEAEFNMMGFRRRFFDMIPGIAHDGQAVSFVRPEPGREQIHVVLYRAGDGFDAAAHLEANELTNPLGHMAMVLSGRSADYRTGAQRFHAVLRWSGLSYRWTEH